jgi:hypothetical protein
VAETDQGVRPNPWFWFCAHDQTTAPDGDGIAVCVRCHTAVTVRLTLQMLEQAFRLMMGEQYNEDAER